MKRDGQIPRHSAWLALGGSVLSYAVLLVLATVLFVLVPYAVFLIFF